VTSTPRKGDSTSTRARGSGRRGVVSAGQTGPADTALLALTKPVIDRAVKQNPKLTPAEPAQIAAAANQIRSLLGTIPPGSGIPAAEASLFDLISTISALGLAARLKRVC
jgi:hypothetical protein